MRDRFAGSSAWRVKFCPKRQQIKTTRLVEGKKLVEYIDPASVFDWYRDALLCLVQAGIVPPPTNVVRGLTKRELEPPGGH